MDLIDFVFGVVTETTPMKDDQRSKLYNEINEDLKNTITDPTHELYKPTLKAKVLKFFRSPWVRLGLACLYLPTIKYIKDWYNGRFDNDDDDDDEKEIRSAPLPGQVFNQK